jgi:glycosyltransferase involved in cell wall biosynthesis
MKKKVLIIAYYWPPAGGPGVQRWVKFIKYLPDFDIEPILYIPKNPTYPILDKSLTHEVSDELTTLKKAIFEPLRIAQLFSKKQAKTLSAGIIKNKTRQSVLERLMLYIRGNYFVPDARKFWVKPSINYLKNYIQEQAIDIIITTGPPHSLHLIGLGLKEQLNIKWIADFRDPWTSISYHKKLKINAKAQKKHKALEEKVLQTADEIIVTSPSTKAEFEQITKQNISVITNGYDDSPGEKTLLDQKFSLAHIGSLLADRNPTILWEILGELIQENKDFKKDFVLKLAGTISDDVLENIKSYGLEKHLDLLGYIPHKEIINLQKSSQVLLLITINSDETKGIIPGKLFEYMVSGRPILGIGAKNADFKQILQQTNTGKSFNYTDKETLKKQLLTYYKAYQEHNLKTFPIGLQQYHREVLTKRLVTLINGVTSGS